MILVITDAHEGSIKRFSCTGKTRKLTHVARADRPLTFTPDFVMMYRDKPPAEHEMYDPNEPHPTGPRRVEQAA